MKTILWILLGLVVTGIVFWMLVNQRIPQTLLAETLVFVFFAAPSVGAFWLLYMAVRFEKHPLPFILLAFIPYGFLGYYFERVRPNRNKTRDLLPKS